MYTMDLVRELLGEHMSEVGSVVLYTKGTPVRVGINKGDSVELTPEGEELLAFMTKDSVPKSSEESTEE